MESQAGTILRQARNAARMTRQELGVRAGVTARSVKAYESGERTPNRQVLAALGVAAGLNQGSLNVLLLAAGYAPAPQRVHCYHRGSCVDDLLSQQAEWPQFVLNDGLFLVGANRFARRLLELQAYGGELKAVNFLTYCHDASLNNTLQNWNEVVAVLVGLYKSRNANVVEASESLLANVGPKELCAQIQVMWNETPSRGLLDRTTYDVWWRRDGSRHALRFRAALMPGHVAQRLTFGEWYPADALTWRYLQRAIGGSLASHRRRLGGSSL